MQLVLVAIALFLFLRADAQELPFQTYTTRDGLPSNQINAIYQDSRGYLWVGTNNGLSVFDGISFKNYSTIDGLPNNWITSITESRTHPGAMWIGTIADGIGKFASGVFTRVETENEDASKLVTGIHEDMAGRVWVVTLNGIYVIENNLATLILPRYNLRLCGDLIETANGRLWIGAGNTVLIYSNDLGRIHSKQVAPNDDVYILSMMRSRDGRVWVGTSDSRLHEFTDTNLVHSHELAAGIPHSIDEDMEGDIWIRSVHSVIRLSEKNGQLSVIRRYTTEDFVPSAHWAGPQLIDREDNYWLGTWTKGLMKVTEKNTYKFPLFKVDYAADVWQGHVWVMTGQGLTETYLNREGDWEQFVHQNPEMTGNHIVRAYGSKMIDSFGRIWVQRADSSAIIAYRIVPRPGLPSLLTPAFSLRKGIHFTEFPLSYRVDAHNRIWLGSSRVDIIDLSTGQFIRSFTADDGVPGNSVRVIFHDIAGNTWIGDYDQGLALIRPTKEQGYTVKKYSRKDGLPDNRIRSVYQDRDGRIWIGTRHGGVAKYNNGSFEITSTAHGLQSNSIWEMFDDDRGRLWLFTDIGVECIDRRSRRVLPTKRVPGERLFTAGLVSDTYFYVVSPTGITMYENHNGSTPAVPPLIHITSVDVNGQAFSERSALNLSHNQNNVAIHFLGLNLQDETSTKYQYRLIELDTAWSAPTRERTITYAALRPGSYTFEVIAVNAYGISSEEQAFLAFTIAPPFWRHWSFIGLVAATIGGVLWLIYTSRVKKVLELERLRVRIASDLHDDVGTNLSSILIASQIMERQPELSENDRARIRDIGSLAATTQEMMKDIVWMLNPKNDSFEDLLLKMKEVAGRLFQHTHYTIAVTDELLSRKISIEFKKNLFLIVKETLHNIAKHSSATEVHVEIRQDSEILRLEIRDNGSGFDPRHTSPGNGLENIHRRAAQIGGTAHITSSAGRGTVMRLTVKKHSNG
jgi:signal transduction histidine kinase/ligand-binding sensor domain-containing protein